MHARNETSLRIYPVGTVLIAMYGGFKQIGRTGLLRIPAAVNQAITAIQPATNILWPEYQLMALNYRVDHWKGVASSSRKDPNITSHDIRSFCIALPSVSEQRAISEALGDLDALLGSLTQLIAKKRYLKQAATHLLLTSKQRLPGFSGEWRVLTFGDLFQVAAGGDVDPARSRPNRDEVFPYPIYSNAIEHSGLYGSCSYAEHQPDARSSRAIGSGDTRSRQLQSITRIQQSVGSSFYSRRVRWMDGSSPR